MMATAEQKRQLRKIVGDAAAEGLNIVFGEQTQASIDLILGNRDEYGEKVIQNVVKGARDLAVRDLHAEREPMFLLEYPGGYRVKSIAEQVATIRRLFPHLHISRPSKKMGEKGSPQLAEGQFAFPRWERFSRTYSGAVMEVLDVLRRTRPLYDHCGRLAEENLLQTGRTTRMMKKIYAAQPDSDIVVFPAQFGRERRGLSVSRAHKAFEPNEFGLGAFAVCIMALTHPERFVGENELSVACAGDGYHSRRHGVSDGALVFKVWKQPFVSLEVWDMHKSHDFYGSATGFLQE